MPESIGPGSSEVKELMELVLLGRITAEVEFEISTTTTGSIDVLGTNQTEPISLGGNLDAVLERTC